jgi:Tol biopolymer transport system component
MDVWVMDVAAGNLTQLTSDRAYDADPSWSPDGLRICFTSTRAGKMDLWVMAADGTDLWQITGHGDDEGENQQPSWGR